MADQYTAAPVKGLKTHNAAVPGATNVGVLAAIATAANPTFTEGNQVGLSTDLTGALRVNISSAGGTNVTYNTTPPTLTNGQTAPIQGDANGNLKVNLITALPTGANTIGAVTQASGPWTQNLTQVGGTAVATSNGVVGAGVQRVVIASDQTAFGVNVASALPTGGNVIGGVTQSGGPWTVNNTQINGNAFATGNGVVGTGVQRVAIASDNTAFAVNATLQTGSNVIGAVTQSAGPWTQNLTQVGGNAVSTGNGVSGTGVLRVAIASDQTAFSVNAVQSGTWAVNASTFIGGAASAAGAGAVNANTQRVILASDQTAVATPLYVRLTDGAAAFGTSANPLYVVNNDVAGTLTDSGQLASGGFGSPTDVAAAGGTATMTGTDVANSSTARLAEFTFASSVRCRVELQIASGATGTTVTTRRVFFVEANTPFSYSPHDSDFISFTSGGTGNHFQIKATNLDTLTAAPVYGTITHAI